MPPGLRWKFSYNKTDGFLTQCPNPTPLPRRTTGSRKRDETLVLCPDLPAVIARDQRLKRPATASVIWARSVMATPVGEQPTASAPQMSRILSLFMGRSVQVRTGLRQ